MGGTYSWSKAPTTLSVTGSSRPTFTGSTINVATYGALGNGVHDDYSNIQAAISALASGDTLEFPAGTYLVDTSSNHQLVIPSGLSNIRIEGDSTSDTTILFVFPVANTGYGKFEMGQPWLGGAARGPIEFDSMTMEYNGSSAVSDGGALLRLRTSSGDIFNGVTLISGPLDAVDTTGSSDFTIENSTMIGGSGAGEIFLAGGTDDFFNNDAFFMGNDVEAGNVDFFNQVSNNRFENTLTGVQIAPADDTRPNNSPDGVGAVIRDNTVMGGVAGIIASGLAIPTWSDFQPVAGNSYPLTLAIIEHNLVAPSAQTGQIHAPNFFPAIIPAGALVVQGNNVDALLYDNFAIEPSPLEGSSFALPPAVYYDLPAPSAAILLRNNQYSGFGSNTYVDASGVSSPSLFEMPYDVFYAAAASGDSSALSIPLWDDGAASRSWSASIGMGASWLSITSGDSSSGTISGEDDNSSDSMLFLTADSTGLSAGTHSATVTITAGGQTRVVTVVFTVT